MHKLLFLSILLVSKFINAQEIDDKSFNKFYQDNILQSKGILVVNFWATWCKPCIQELPSFERINSETDPEMLNIYLVNLDFNGKFRISATEFVKTRNIKSPVVHINDTDPNDWINKVDSAWSGAIPATAIYVNGKKCFFKEGEMTYEELSSVISGIENK